MSAVSLLRSTIYETPCPPVELQSALNTAEKECSRLRVRVAVLETSLPILLEQARLTAQKEELHKIRQAESDKKHHPEGTGEGAGPEEADSQSSSGEG